MDRLGGLVVIAPAHTAGDPGSNPGPGDNSFLKLLIYEGQSISDASYYFFLKYVS